MTDESLPKVSVLIHNRNRADCLARCLESVARQEARPLEVVVLDAQSTDDSSAVLANQKLALEAVGIHVVVESCEPAGVPASRNLASSHATGELLLFLDNDATLDRPDTVSWLQRYFKQHEDLGLAGCQILARDTDEEDPFCWVYRRSVRQWQMAPFDTFTFAGAGFCVRASAYKECGGFWEVIQYSREEEALALRLLDHGWRVAYRPEAVVRHYPDPRGRRSLMERRAVELKNGVLIYWHAYPFGAGFAFSVLRVTSMSLRALRRREGSLRTLLTGWTDARRCWREAGLRREPVAWRTMLRLLQLHFSKGSDDVNAS
jgi:GT2 family glycosyltransferase